MQYEMAFQPHRIICVCCLSGSYLVARPFWSTKWHGVPHAII